MWKTPIKEDTSCRGKNNFDANDILEDEEIDVVVEVMGKEHPALEYIIKALKKVSMLSLQTKKS